LNIGLQIACSYLNQTRKWTTIIFWAFATLGIIALLTGLVGRIDGVFHHQCRGFFCKKEVKFLGFNPLDVRAFEQLGVR
jgi:hypothetical protein